MVRLVAAAALALALAVAGPARADSPHVAEARRAIEAVQYEEAQALLVQALTDGGNAPATVVELYRLSATTAIVLGQRDAAEQYYRRLLALDPTATLPDDLAPKLREPFIAAQAYMGAHGRLAAHATRDGDGIEVVVDSDPLAMAAAAIATTAPGPPTPLAGGRARLATAAPAVAILDEHGNRLRELAVAAPAPLPRGVRPGKRRVPLYRRWVAWAIPTGVALAAGVGFGLAARSADGDLADILAHSDQHFWSDAEAARDRRDRWALAANLSLGVAGALAVVTAIVFVTRPDSEVVVIPPAAGQGAVVSLSGRL